ncbi:MAG: right-handed parallel beta-helix repeat-containing protein [Planctomycetota bacterium]|jgi:hypothetical protein
MPALVVAVAASTHGGITILVPDDYPSIGAAITAARRGDTVIVADGVYTGPDNRDLTFSGKDIVVRSANGPAACIIDCQLQGRAFMLVDGETRAAVIEGFTIRNGNVENSNGGGIDIGLSTSPTIRNCVFRNNTASALGGGMAVRGQCTPIIDRCTFINNASFGTEESSEGGGLCLFFLSPATVTNCVFIDNFSEYGGGLSCALSDATIVNCLFVGNTAAIGGGGVASDVSNARLINCTITDNSAGFFGGAAAGITQYLTSHLTIDNSVLWNNSPTEVEVLNGSATVRYSDVEGGWSGEGNIDATPGFVGQTLRGPEDYRITSGSPCIDAGDNTVVPADIVTDLDGQPRFVDDPGMPDSGFGLPPVVDMGAFEFQVATCAADLNGDGVVAVADFLALLANWSGSGVGDIDGSGIVGVQDFLLLLAAWGPCS